MTLDIGINYMDYMDMALNEAKLALENGEVPVGCLFIYKNEIIAKSGNCVNKTKNATCHAEIICIDDTLKYCKNNNLDYMNVFKEISVVVTVEPCIMCSAALHNLNIKEIFYGCKNNRFGGTTVLNVSDYLNQYNITIKGGIKSEEAISLLKKFYEGENPSAPVTKKRKKKIQK